MPTQVAMLRGINVGGSKIIKMDRLRALFAALGFAGAHTYLQSGNVLFSAPADGPAQEAAIRARLLADLGFDIDVAVRSARQLTVAVKRNPLLAPGRDPRHLHATFLIGAHRPSLKGVALPLRPGEEAVLVGDIVYMYCPNGYGETKVHTQFLRRALGVPATTRNWVTVTALEALANGRGAAP
jgi:uncharacterized protein (DUF1697 family)